MAGSASGADRGLLPATLCAGAEPRRVPEQRPEGSGKRGVVAPRQEGGALADPGVYAEVASSSRARYELLSAPVRPVCRRPGYVRIFLAEVISSFLRGSTLENKGPERSARRPRGRWHDDCKKATESPGTREEAPSNQERTSFSPPRGGGRVQ